MDCPDDARSDITVLDNLTKGYEINSQLVDDFCRTDDHSSHLADSSWYPQTPSIDFEEYFCSTHSSGYGTESDASYKTRDYFIARDVGIM